MMADAAQHKQRCPQTDKPPGPAPIISERGYSPLLLIGATRLGDLLTCAMAGFAAHQANLNPTPASFGFVLALIAAPVLTVSVSQCCGWYSYASIRSTSCSLAQVTAAWLFTSVALLGAIHWAGQQAFFSGVFLGTWFGFALGFLCAGRVVAQFLVLTGVRIGRLTPRRVAIVGGGVAAEELIMALGRQANSEFRIVGIFDDRSDKRSPALVGGLPKLGTVTDLLTYSRGNKVDIAVITLPTSAEQRIRQMLSKLWILPIDVRLLAPSSDFDFESRKSSHLAGVYVLDLLDKPMTPLQILIKGAFDRALGMMLLVIALPMLLTTALAIKLDSPGPVYFRQRRYGFNNQLIEVFKFRSMYTERCDSLGTVQVTKGDSRVTRVGRFIRRTSIDELPQLFNVVIFGNLSLVGPRPHAPDSKAGSQRFDQVLDEYFARHKVKPGITGWAQINGWRGETDTEEKLRRRVEHDLDYINRWSVLFDLYILATTPISLLKSKTAY